MTNQHPITVPIGSITFWKISYRATCQDDLSETEYIATQAAQWGADQAAATLQHQWPEPITDRPPTEADGDEDGYVQYLNQYQRWNDASWHGVASALRPWFHTPHWRPKPPSLKKQALLQLDTLSADLAMHGRGCDLSQIRRALEALPND